jgi:hypothetical protein
VRGRQRRKKTASRAKGKQKNGAIGKKTLTRTEPLKHSPELGAMGAEKRPCLFSLLFLEAERGEKAGVWRARSEQRRREPISAAGGALASRLLPAVAHAADLFFLCSFLSLSLFFKCAFSLTRE